jgi:hypothetical protein
VVAKRGSDEGCDGAEELLAPMREADAAIEVQVYRDHCAGVTSAPGAGRDLDDVVVHGDGVVAAHPSLGLEAEDPVEVEVMRERAEGAAGVVGGDGEATVVGGDESGEEGVGGRGIGDIGETELGDEAILPGAPEAFDAALGLG